MSLEISERGQLSWECRECKRGMSWKSYINPEGSASSSSSSSAWLAKPSQIAARAKALAAPSPVEQLRAAQPSRAQMDKVMALALKLQLDPREVLAEAETSEDADFIYDQLHVMWQERLRAEQS